MLNGHFNIFGKPRSSKPGYLVVVTRNDLVLVFGDQKGSTSAKRSRTPVASHRLWEICSNNFCR